MNKSQIKIGIERDVMERWGWKIDVTVFDDGDLAWEGNREVNKDRYDMYPGMSHEDADKVVMDEILAIIRKYLPDFQYTSYEQSGQMHYN